jgi:hypothetical protein
MIPAKEFDGELWIRAADIHLLARDWPRTWSGLTDEQRANAEEGAWFMDEFDKTIYAMNIEAKLKELNS